MPKVRPLTPAQREAEKAAERRKFLAECISNYQNRPGKCKTDEQVAKELDITIYLLQQIKKQKDARMDISTTVRILAAGGFEITRKAVTL